MEGAYAYILKIWGTGSFVVPVLSGIVYEIMEPEHVSLGIDIIVGVFFLLWLTTPFCIGLLLVLWLLNRLEIPVTVIKLITTVLLLVYSWFVLFQTSSSSLLYMEPKDYVIPGIFIITILSSIWFYRLLVPASDQTNAKN